MKRRTLLLLFTLLAFAPLSLLTDFGRTASRAEAAPAAGLTVVSQQCLSADRVRVQFQWTPSGEGSQWIDLSLFNNNFATNTFIGLGPLSSAQGTFTWDGLLAGLPHYVRVNTLTPSGWTPSATAAFSTIAGCQNSAATQLRVVEQVCQPDGRVAVHFAWNPSGQGVQWFDISAVNDNFSAPFYGFGPLAPGMSSIGIPHLEPNDAYYIRVNTFNGAIWAPTSTSFVSRNCVADFTTADKQVNGNAPDMEQAILDDVRTGAHPGDGYDRIVFEFAGPRPDATIGYEDEAVACGSGDTVDVEGSGTLIVRLPDTVAHNDMGQSTSPIEVAGTGAAILEAKSICDFEGIVEWAVGIDGVKGFRVFTLNNPNRIVIDVLR